MSCSDDGDGRGEDTFYPTLGDGDGDGDPGNTETSDSGDGDGDGDGDPTGDGDGDGDPEAVCGDGVVEGDEECDDGNPVQTDACTNACINAVCGDGHVYEGVEMCDDGNAVDDDGCNNACMAGSCGDGVVDGNEVCDDGNDDSTDDCVMCQPASCGDGYTQANVETCDDANDVSTDDCINCSAASCGDGYVQEGVENCDDANDNNTDGCVAGCMAASCGDGYVQANVEACDGNNLDGETCQSQGFSGGQLSCTDNCSDFDDGMCVDDPCNGNGAYVSGYCWIISNGCQTAPEACMAAGHTGVNGSVIGLTWDNATMQAVANGLGVLNGGDAGCCVEFAWYNQQANSIYTHNFGPNFHNWSGCYQNFPTVKACTP